ncbi:MAG TPA: cytochrome P450 [Candidatus Angelobacter sp.]|nr:cytochrome P450 [Candidatus Angelobacter sp.]
MDETPIPPLPGWTPAIGAEDASQCPRRANAQKVRLPHGQEVWLLSGYDICREALTHRALSSDHTHPNYPDVFPIKKSHESQRATLATYSGMDPPEHTLHRRLIAEEFSIESVGKWQQRVFAIAERQLETVLAPQTRSGEIVAQYAEPIASTTIFEFLGVPPERRTEMARLARILLGSGADRQAASAASASFRQLLDALGAEKEADATADDVLSRLIVRYRREGFYSRLQFIEFAGALIAAAHRTATTMIALSVAMLIERPDARRQMFADRAAFDRGLEELLRYLSVADLATARIAVAEVELAGVSIEKGEGTIASTAHANYDIEQFPDAGRFDINRRGPDHVAFGHGPHKCLGQHLARLELEAALRVLFGRFPDLRLENLDAIRIQREGAVLSVDKVRVCW